MQDTLAIPEGKDTIAIQTRSGTANICLHRIGGASLKRGVNALTTRKRRRNTRCPEKPSAGERITQALDIPPIAASGVAHIELMGNREAIVDGVCGVVEYEENIIRLNTGKSMVKFTGKGLAIQVFTQNQAMIAGYIASVEFVL